MRLPSARAALVLPLLLAVAACSGDALTALLHARRLPDGPVAVTRLSAEPYSLTAYSGIGTSLRVVARGEHEWRGLWSAMQGSVTSPSSPPAVDFGHRMVAVASLGPRPTGGFGILIDSARSSAAGLEVFVRTIAPGPTCVTTQVLTSPVDAALIPQTSEPVRFIDVPTVAHC